MVDYKEEIDYNFVEVNGQTGIKIQTGKFTDVIFMYHDISVQEAPEVSDEAVLSFGFTIVDTASQLNEEFFDLEFKTVIGDILMSILAKSVEETVGDDFEFKQTDLEEFDSQ